jgi:hypothetical protein
MNRTASRTPKILPRIGRQSPASLALHKTLPVLSTTPSTRRVPPERQPWIASRFTKVSYSLLPYLYCVQNLALPCNARSRPPIYASCRYARSNFHRSAETLLLLLCIFMASRGRLCIFMAFLVAAAVLAAPAASTADAPRTGARRHHLAPAPAPAGRTSATVPPSKAPAALSPEPPAAAAVAPSSPGDGATVSGATPPGTASSTRPVVTAMIAPLSHTSIAAAALSFWRGGHDPTLRFY